MVQKAHAHLSRRNAAAVLLRHRGAWRHRAGRGVHPAQDRQGLRRHHRRCLEARGRAAPGGPGRRPVRSAVPSRRRRSQAPRPGRAARRRDGAARRRPLQHGDRLRRRHRHRHGRISGRHLHARHPGAADSDHAAGAGGRGHRRQDRRQPGERQESDRQLSPAAGRADRSRRARYAAGARVPRRTVRNHQGRHHPRARALSPTWPNPAPTCSRASRRPWTTSSPSACA